MVQKILKVGFIGKGKHATTNLYPSLPYAGIKVVATCAKHNADYNDFRVMMNTAKMDAVIACVNSKVHYEIAKEAAKHNLPLFLEKPPVENSDQALELIKLGGKIMVGFNKRFGKTYMMAKKIIGKEADALNINASVGYIGNTKELLMEVGIHYVDLCKYFNAKKSHFHLAGGVSWKNANEHIEIIKGKDRVVIENVHKLTHYHGDTITVWEPNYMVPDIENHLIYLNGYIGELTAFANGNYSPGMLEAYEAIKYIEDKCGLDKN